MLAIDGEFGRSAFLSGLISSLMASGVHSLGINFGASTENNTVYNSFGKEYMKATMLVTGGLSGAISSSIAGGKFWDGFRQGIITSGLNHVAHLVAGPGSTKVYDDEGDYVGKMKVSAYELYTDPDTGEKGLHIELQFTSASNKYSDYKWVQTVGTNDPPGGGGYREYNDHHKPYENKGPFYYAKSDYIQYPQIKQGNQHIFTDTPLRAATSFNIGWRAELSLVGFNSSGAHALHTVTYGFNVYSNGHSLLMPLKSKEYANRYWWLKK